MKEGYLPMGNIIYSRKQYRIYRECDGYIVHNTSKNFNNGHTHINNYNTAKHILNMARHKSIPHKSIGNYLIDSLIRLSTDKGYIRKLKELKKR